MGGPWKEVESPEKRYLPIFSTTARTDTGVVAVEVQPSIDDGSASCNRDHNNNHNHHNNHSHGHSHNHGGGYSNKLEWLQQYDLIGKIGEGTYGLVFLVRTKSPSNRGKSIAIKKFKQSKDDDGVSPTTIREIMLLREISHENVVKLMNVHINHTDMSIYLAFGILKPHKPTRTLFVLEKAKKSLKFCNSLPEINTTSNKERLNSAVRLELGPVDSLAEEAEVRLCATFNFFLSASSFETKTAGGS